MQGERKREKKRMMRWRIVSFLSALLLLIVACSTVYVQSEYQMQVPDELLGMCFVQRSPQFFAYRFDDRTNRIGKAYDVTSAVYAQKQVAYVSYEDLPQALIDAFVAIEDKHFFEHSGVDWIRTMAAGANYILGFSKRFGASTITQQLIKNMTGEADVSVKRKLQEIFYARDLERRLDKTEIMELYLNVIHFSDQCDGIGVAAEHYFSKRPKDLSVAECASLAAITNNPSYYNPIRNPENNLARRNLILREMYAQGFLNTAEYEHAMATPLNLMVNEAVVSDGINSWYTDMVIADVICDLMAEYGMSRAAAARLVYTGGLRIDMAIDMEMQAMAEEYYWKNVHMPQNAKGESAQSAMIVIDSRTGDVLAVVGAVGEKKGNHLQNFATQTLRPPGSTIKPLSVYAPALEEGVINWASVYDDVPIEFDANGRSAWPKNANGVYRGLTDVSYAVAHSTNTVAVRILNDLGVQKSFHYAKEKFHLTGLLAGCNGKSDCNVSALALGQPYYGVTLRELTAAYTAFADAGVYHQYRSYYRVTDAEGKILLACPDSGEVVLSAPNAAIMTKLLQGVITDGTSSVVTLQNITECAGKTGTTSNDYDRWFIGYTPDLICGVWCGYEYPEPLVGKNPSTEIWNDLMRTIVLQNGGRREFEVPDTLVRVSYCKDSGKLLTDACCADPRGSRCEIGWFLHGEEPSAFCDCHILCDYDRVTGGVSHGFCHAEDIDKIGLLRIERHFPIQIYVTDAEYVYRGDPLDIEPNDRTEEPYFAALLKDFCGISNKSRQFNCSCKEHASPSDDEKSDKPDRMIIPWRYDFEE